MNRVKPLMVTIVSFTCTSLLLLSGCTGTLETKGDTDSPSASERQQALLDACDNKQGGEACTVEFRGREIFSGTCVDTDIGTRCLTDDAASAVEDIKTKVQNRRNTNGQSGNADAGNRSGGNGSADAGSRNGGNGNADAGTRTGTGDAGNQHGGNRSVDAGNRNGGSASADAGASNGGNSKAAPNNPGGQNTPGDAGAKEGLDLTEACEGKNDGDACTVSVDGREVYSGSCKFGFCVP